MTQATGAWSSSYEHVSSTPPSEDPELSELLLLSRLRPVRQCTPDASAAGGEGDTSSQAPKQRRQNPSSNVMHEAYCRRTAPMYFRCCLRAPTIVVLASLASAGAPLRWCGACDGIVALLASRWLALQQVEHRTFGSAA